MYVTDKMIHDMVVELIPLSGDEPAFPESPKMGSILDNLESSDPSPEELAAKARLRDTLWAMVQRHTTPREAQVLRERFLRGRTMADIARDMDLSRERIRQVQERALKKLRRVLAAERRRLFPRPPARREDELPAPPTEEAREHALQVLCEYGELPPRRFARVVAFASRRYRPPQDAAWARWVWARYEEAR